MDSIIGLRGSFWRKALSAGILVILADVLLFDKPVGGSIIGLFMAAWAGLSFAVHRAGWRNIWSLTAFGLATGFAAVMTYDPSFLGFVMFLGTLTLAVLLTRIKGVGDGWYWFKRLAFHAIATPFTPLFDLNRLAEARRRPGVRRSVSSWLPNLILPVIGTLLFVALFAMANPIISGFLDTIQIGSLTENDIARVIFWGLIFVAVWASLRPLRPKKMFNRLAESEPGRIAGVTIASVTLSLIIFNLLFALQNGMDLIYIWGDVRLPQEFTLAEYAHRGAYPLIITALLAGLFVLMTTHPRSELAGNKLIRWLIIIWIAQNLFLVASTVERTLLYIESYSLTELRISALLWMGLVAVGLVLVTWRMLRGNSLAWLVNGNVLAAFITLSACTIVDLGATAATWNVRHAREVGGEGVHLDLCYLNQLEGSSLTALASLEQRPKLDPAFLQRVILVRQEVQKRIALRQKEKGGWDWRDAQRMDALNGQKLKRLSIPKGYYVDCDGHLRPNGERYSEDANYAR
ncbi:MAG: DUF4173 domain-containing protein [Sphingorhabdus sp.]